MWKHLVNTERPKTRKNMEKINLLNFPNTWYFIR